ncbi:MAG: hypothetical protein Q9211_002667 [Gyalolechia sp. 1 TL-2023]
MIPRMLRPTTHRDLRGKFEIFGQKLESPILIAPVGVQTIFHHDKELGVAEVAREIGIPYILSTASSSSIEEVAEANGDGTRWYQLYWPQDHEITKSVSPPITQSISLHVSPMEICGLTHSVSGWKLLRRAKSNGFKVLVVTLDTWALAWRPADLDNAYIPFASGIGDQTGFSDPAFRAKFAKLYDNKTPEDDVFLASRQWEADVFSGAAHTWEELDLIKAEWDGPIVLKGIQHIEDAKKAAEMGMDGIVVSNHGGRQLDGAIGSLEVLPEIVEAVGDKLTVLFDSGIRTGVDVIKALCLGAKGVLIGRYFDLEQLLGRRGKANWVQTDLDQSMGLAGIKTIADCNRSMIRRVQYGGDTISSL